MSDPVSRKGFVAILGTARAAVAVHAMQMAQAGATPAAGSLA